MIKYVSVLFLVVFLISCNEGDYVPKPRGLNHIDLPTQEYQLFDEVDKPYSFEYSSVATAKAYDGDTTGYAKLYKDINYESFGAVVHLTYKEVKNNIDTLNSLINESFKLAQRHNKKAYAIEDRMMVSASGNVATVIDIVGEVPSPYQFFMHDSTTHFIKGVLYFPTSTKNDSLRPVIDFIKSDMHHMINTMCWK